MRKSYVVTLLAALLWAVVAFALHDYWRDDTSAQQLPTLDPEELLAKSPVGQVLLLSLIHI